MGFFRKSKSKSRNYRKRFFQVNKVAKIKTADLPIKHSKGEPPEHYVFIRDYDREKQVYSVNVCTHLDKYNRKTKKYELNEKHLQQVKYGNTYSVPLRSANFPTWTGIKKDVYKIPKGVMYQFNCVKFKKPHKKEKHDEYFK